MGSYVLYVLMQAMGALAFAYMGGILAMKDRRPCIILAAAGLYLIMGASLLAIWGDRGGWSAGGLGQFIALISAGVACIGAGSLLRESEHSENGHQMELGAKVIIVLAATMAVALASIGGSMDSVVDSEAVMGTEISGGFSNLGPLGLALGAPMLLGAGAIIISGARMSLVRRDGRGLWLWGAGILFVLWPFNPLLNNLPLTPTLLILALAMAYFGFQEPAKEDEPEKPVGPKQTGIDSWLKKEERPDEGDETLVKIDAAEEVSDGRAASQPPKVEL